MGDISPAVEWSRQALQLRSEALSRELRLAARVARRNPLPLLYRISTIALGSALIVRKRFSRSLVASFVLLAVVPSFFSILYFSFIAASQYSSVAKFAVRSGDATIADAMSSGAGLASLQQAQDTLIIADYVKSRAIVEALGRKLNLVAIFSSPQIDYLSSYRSDHSIENLTRYWRGKILATVEYNSGIVTVETFAFSPEDALKLAQAVVVLSEDLINSMSNRAQADLVSQSEKELERVQERLRQSTRTLTELRNSEGLIDPRQRGDAINKLIDQIKSDRLKIEQEITSLSRSLTANSPQLQVLRLRVEAANGQIAELDKRLTNDSSANVSSISKSISKFDEVELERQVAERQYFLASTNLASARVAAERQRQYLTTFVQPVLSDEALYPNRILFSLMSVAASIVFWAVSTIVWLMLRKNFKASFGQ